MTLSNATIIRRANDALLAEGRVEAANDYFTVDYVAHVTGGDLPPGQDAVRRFVEILRSAFAGLEVRVDVLVESDDRVAWQRTLTGRHEGAFMGFPPTNRAIIWRDMLTSRFEGERIAEEWAVSDLAERLLLARKG